MSKTPELVALVREIAAAHGLDHALVCAVVEHESRWNPWAVRYEPDFFARYVLPLFTRGAFRVTEAQTRTMSFGLMQVMGEVAREEGFQGEFLTELCDPRLGVEYGCRTLWKRMLAHEGRTADALLAYNGGADKAYPGEVLALLPNYQGEAT